MEKKPSFGVSNEIIEIPVVYENLGKELANKFCNAINQPLFIEIDCVPNGELNVFKLGNGLDSAKTIANIAGTFLGDDKRWLEEKIKNITSSTWQPDYSIGEDLSIWKRIDNNNYNQLLDWSRPFCIKNTKGLTKIWHPEWRKFSRTGFATRKSIINFILGEKVYLQPFFIPLVAVNNPDWRMVYRLVFLSNGNNNSEFIGGLWISRPEFKIYPDKDSIVGLISTKKP